MNIRKSIHDRQKKCTFLEKNVGIKSFFSDSHVCSFVQKYEYDNENEELNTNSMRIVCKFLHYQISTRKFQRFRRHFYRGNQTMNYGSTYLHLDR